MPPPKFRPSTRYRYGERSSATRTEHAVQSREYRRALADADFDLPTRMAFLAALMTCADVVRAAEIVGYRHHTVYGRMRYDPTFAEQVETILSQVCVAIGHGCCGTASGYKRGGRCWSCRSAHHAVR